MDPNLTKLCKLLDFAAEAMGAANIPSLLQQRGAKSHLFMLIVAGHNYSESVCVLCKQGRTHAAFVLLRSLCECLIKSRYLYCNPRLHLWELRLEAFMEKHKQLNAMKGFLASSRSTDAHRANLSLDEVETCLNQLDHSMVYCERSFRKYGGQFNDRGKPVIKGALSKAEYVDKHNSDMNAKSESLAYFYHLVYRQLSSGVHLDGRNFSDFLSWNEDGCETLLSGNPEDVPNVARLALWLYHQLIRQFFIVYRLPHIRQMNIILGDG